MSACGYEVVRTITSQYSIVSHMEAVYVRDSALKLFQSGRNQEADGFDLEDAFAKSESKLTNFPELKLSEADRCSVLLQSLSAEVRQYVVLHGKHSGLDLRLQTHICTQYENFETGPTLIKTGVAFCFALR